MSTLTTNYFDIIERLPAGAKLELPDVDWDEYEHLLTQMESFHPGHRLSYDSGRLIIVSPKREHEFFKAFVSRVVHALAEELSLNIEATGATTLRRGKLMKGVEADESFYVQNAARIIGHLELDLDVDPPPDVAVEIDMSHDSLDKFPIYAALGVPEIWRYDGQSTRFYKLAGESYEMIQNSIALPSLTAEDLTQYLEQSKTEGQTAALKAFRRMLRSRTSS
ncbi:MAG TPA: Uma2 family endonuclease [Pyrinomonadaceae bacterium]|jgi:Uma2 family endonuclease